MIEMQSQSEAPKPKDYIDLRSDVISVPPHEMLQAMWGAEVGDDVFQDDPTANKFQQMAAEFFGFEASMIVPSTTMANLISVLLLTRPGDEVIVWGNSHTIQRQSAGIASICGVQTRQILEDSGVFTLDSIKKRVRKQSQHITFPNTSLIFIQNPTFTGQVWPLEALSSLKSYAEQQGVKVLMDGARITNATAYYGCDPKEMSKYCDVMTMCLSKGLCCPFGSLVFGSSQQMKEARHIRKSLGGGMRQIGIIGAAGIYALKHIVPQVKTDNQMALNIAQGLSSITGVEVDKVQSNILNFKVKIQDFNHNQYITFLLKNMIKIKPFNEDRQEYRVVTHRTIRELQCQKFVSLTQQYCHSYGKNPKLGQQQQSFAESQPQTKNDTAI